MHRVRETVHRGALATALFGALIALAYASGVGAEARADERQGTEFGLGIEVRPNGLPKAEAAPAELLLTSEVDKPDGSHPPALGQLDIDLDRNVTIDLTGIPPCAPGPTLQVYPAPDPPKDCKKSIVGRGRATTEIAFPDSCCVPPIESSLLILSGGVRRGVATLFAHFDMTVPVPATIVITIKIERTRNGRYGTRMTFSVPKIAGGSGSLTSLRMRLFKRFRREGDLRSVVTARCAGGELLARADAAFAEGARSHSRATQPCTQRD